MVEDSSLAMVSGSCPRDTLGEVAGRRWGRTLVGSMEGSSHDLQVLTYPVLMLSN